MPKLVPCRSQSTTPPSEGSMTGEGVINHLESVLNDADEDRLIIDEQAEGYGDRELSYREAINSTPAAVAHVETTPVCILGRQYDSKNERTAFNKSQNQSATSGMFCVQSNGSGDVVSIFRTRNNYDTEEGIRRGISPAELLSTFLPLNKSMLNLNLAYRKQSSDDDEPLERDRDVTDAGASPVTHQHPSPLSDSVEDESSENFFPSPRHAYDYGCYSREEYMEGRYVDYVKRSSLGRDVILRRGEVSNDISCAGEYVEVENRFREVRRGDEMTGYVCNEGKVNEQDGREMKQKPETETCRKDQKNDVICAANNSMFSCHLCDNVAKSKAEYTSHMRSIHFKNLCSYCGYSSRTLGRLKRHVMDFHSAVNGDGTEKKKLKRKKKHSCRDCSFITDDQNEYWVHIRGHIPEEKQLLCTRCAFVTSCKHHMEYHLRNHVGSKPYKCERCNYQCINKAMLKSHMKSHDNFYPYRCANCTYAAKYLHALNMHLKKTGHVVNTQIHGKSSLVRSKSQNVSGRKLGKTNAVHEDNTSKAVTLDRLAPIADSETGNSMFTSTDAIGSNILRNDQTNLLTKFRLQAFLRHTQPQDFQGVCDYNPRDNLDRSSGIVPVNSSVCDLQRSSQGTTKPSFLPPHGNIPNLNLPATSRSFTNNSLPISAYRSIEITENVPSVSAVTNNSITNPNLILRPNVLSFKNNSMPISADYTNKITENVSSVSTYDKNSTSRSQQCPQELDYSAAEDQNLLEVKVESVEDETAAVQLMEEETITQMSDDDDILLHRWNKKRRQPISAEVISKQPPVTELVQLRKEMSVVVLVNEHSIPEDVQLPLDLSKRRNTRYNASNEHPLNFNGSFNLRELRELDVIPKIKHSENIRGTVWGTDENLCESKKRNYSVRDETFSPSVDTPRHNSMSHYESKMTNCSTRNEALFSNVQSTRHNSMNHTFLNRAPSNYKSRVVDFHHRQAIVAPYHTHQTLVQPKPKEQQQEANMYNPPQGLHQGHLSQWKEPFTSSLTVMDQNMADSFECPHCSIIFTDHVLFAFHMSFHSRGDPFRCSKCCAETGNNREFFLHIGRVAHSG